LDDLANDYFLLAIQTEYQKDALKHYGNSVIMMDATHGTTHYDFLLIIISVIDDHGAGLPVAWAISNREDCALLMQFLRGVKARVGDLQTITTGLKQQSEAVGSDGDVHHNDVLCQREQLLLLVVIHVAFDVPKDGSLGQQDDDGGVCLSPPVVEESFGE
jgi:hypothetical protein